MTAETKKKTRKSLVCTFSNHAPIRFWGEFNRDEMSDKRQDGDYIDDYVYVLWNAQKDFGHHNIEYYICRKSGKRIYFASYNSGESYGTHSPRTTRTYLENAEAIKTYFGEMNRMDEWYLVCGSVDPNLIVDSGLL